MHVGSIWNYSGEKNSKKFPNILPYHDNSNCHIVTSYHDQQENVHQHGNYYYQPTSELLDMFPLNTCTQSIDLLRNSSISLATPDGTVANTAVHETLLLLPLNLPPHPPMSMNELFTLVSVRYGRNNTERAFATERQRRVHLNERYVTLRSLIPIPSKPDRVSVIGGAIRYIQELKKVVNELKFLVDKKRCAKQRTKQPKMEDGLEINEPKTENIDDQPYKYNGPSSLRSSWLNRKSKNTEVDVRIVNDEVTIKFVQRERVNCLLFVAKVLDELQLDLYHVSGGLEGGDYFSFSFKSKICEGSSLYAHAIANKLNDVVDNQYVPIPIINDVADD